MIPKEKEKENSLNALKSLNFRSNSYKSYTNVEKVLRLPKKPIIKNNTNCDEKVKELILGKVEINKPRRKEEKVFTAKIISFPFTFISLNLW